MSWVARLIGGPNWAVIEQAGAQPAASLAYPAEVDLDGLSVLLRTLHPGDEEALLAFARSLPTHDLRRSQAMNAPPSRTRRNYS